MINVTAATGRLGRLVIEELLQRGVPADQIVAAARTLHKAADLAARGLLIRKVQVRVLPGAQKPRSAT